MAQILLNNVTTKLTAAISAVATSITVTAGTGALFALATGGNKIRATLVKTSGYKEVAWEIVDVTARSTDTLTITRALEGTTGLTFAIGDVLDCRITAGTSYENTNGNLNFTGLAQRITGDMSNATVANRLAFQTSTVNGNTSVAALPNGTSVTSNLRAFNAADPTNAGYVQMLAGSAAMALTSRAEGSGTVLPLVAIVGIKEGWRIDVNGNIGLGGTVPSAWAPASATGSAVQAGFGSTWAISNTYGIANNLYWDGSAWKYVSTAAAALMQFPVNGGINFNTTPSGTAGTNASMTTVCQITNAGLFKANYGIVTSSINGGQLAGFRNVIRNGGAQVAQRSAPTLTAAPQYGAVDGFQVQINVGTGISGTIGQSSSASFVTGKAVGISSASWTTGQALFSTKVESVDCRNMNGKTVTFSCKVYHDFGASRNFVADLYKANTLDNFGSLTPIGFFTAATACASGDVTTITGSLTLGATDAENGLQIRIYDQVANTVVSKNVLLGDVQLEISSVASTFEQIPYAMQLAWCQRYLVKSGHQVPATTAQNIRPLNMRITPTITGGGAGFTSTNTSKDALIAFQTTNGFQTLTLTAEL